MTSPSLDLNGSPAVEDDPGSSGPDARGYTSDEALAKLREEHGRALFGFLLGLTYGDRQRAEDLLQETMIRAWRHPEALETDHESMRPWLYTVARRLAIDARRARLSRPTEVGDMAMQTIPVQVEDPIEPSIEALDVRKALKELSNEHRQVLIQVYFRGSSVQEASETLGIPVGTVKSRTYYALRALKSCLAEYATLG
ncbi:sigma-70 family RNA polymerase sigma factor [Streptomyces sp. NPDC001941]|uniref:sigma-70 family RNA polymerase sigma factor n=1 Tax=Streptomyces sp. NPDC001941 TaxID=3154659 RepID=UPI0033307C5A